MTVHRNDIDNMARLIAIMNGNDAPEPAQRMVEGKDNPAPASSADAGIAAMKSILERFHNSTAGVDRVARSLVNESKVDSELRMALKTQGTQQGVQIGEWEIRVKPDNGRKFYDIASKDTGVVIADDLTLYEAAYGIAKALAEGKTITSPVVRSILTFEAEYAGALTTAIHFRHSLNGSKAKKITEGRRFVIEDRYSAAKLKAARARAEVERLAGPLPF